MQDLKRWHWVAIGLLLGGLLGGSRLMWPPEPVGRNIKQKEFESLLVRYEPSAPALTNIVVHPRPEGGHVVTGDIWHPDGSGADAAQGRRVWFKAADQYQPLDTGGQAISDGSVVEYLEQLSAAQLIVAPRVAWWERPWAVMGLWAVGAAFIIGGLWPLVLNVLVGAGFGRSARDPEYDLRRFKSEKAKKSLRPKVTSEDMAKLAALEAALEAQLATWEGTQEAPPQPTSDAASVKALSVTTLESTETSTEGAPSKEFGGDAEDYYPTEVHANQHPK